MRTVIEPERLAVLLDGPTPPTVLDVRWSLGGPPGRAAFAAGHLPGAVYLDLDTDLAGPPGPGGRHPLPDPDALQVTLRAAGVRGDRPVVTYDDADSSVAARAWWLLRWAGHGEVAVLDGGYAAWLAAGLPTSTDVPVPEPGDVVVTPGRMPVVDSDRAAAIGHVGVLLDARVGARYRGEAEPLDPMAGHIPGAVSAPFGALTGPDGSWRTPADLHRLAAGWGVAGEAGDAGEAGEEVAAYCGSGVTACALVLALEHAGVTSARRPAALYPGSWSQWCTDPARRPVATGPDPG